MLAGDLSGLQWATGGVWGGVLWAEIVGDSRSPNPLSRSALVDIPQAEGLKIKPLAGLATTETGTLLEHHFAAITIAPVGCKGHCSVLIERAAVLAIQHVEAGPLDGAAAFLQGLAPGRFRLAGFAMGAQQMAYRPWIRGRQGEVAVARAHQLLGGLRQLLPGNQGPAAAAVGTPATGARRLLARGGCPGEAQGFGGGWGHGLGRGAPVWSAADAGLNRSLGPMGAPAVVWMAAECRLAYPVWVQRKAVITAQDRS